jgi:hypothetical protein
MELPAFFGRLFDGLLRLFFRSHKEDFAALADRGSEKIASGLQLLERFAKVNDMDAIPRIEDERLHPGVPTLGLVPKMDAGIEQFL